MSTKNIFKGSSLKQKSNFYSCKYIRFFIAYELDTFSQDLNSDFTLQDCLFGGVKLAKNTDINTYILVMVLDWFCVHNFHYLTVARVKNVIIFGVNMISYVHIDNKKKDILILDKGPTQGLDDIALTAEAQNSIDFLRSNRKFSLSLHCNGSSSFLFVNDRIVYQFKAKDSETKK